MLKQLFHTRALWRDVRDRALILDQVADAVGVVGTVGLDDAPLGQVDQQMLGRAAIGRLARRQMKGERAAMAVGDGVDLGVPATPTAADRLRAGPPLPPAAERCAFTCVLSISISADGPHAATSVSKTSRHTPYCCPADASVVERLGRSVEGRHILPPAAELEHVHDAADDTAIIDARYAPRLFGQKWLQPRPLIVA